MKPYTDATHFRLEAYRHVDGHLKTILYYEVSCELHEAARIMADVVIRELGDGDGENGGSGSLKNCYGGIVDCFMDGHPYEYADCEFHVYAIPQCPTLHVGDFMK